MTDLKIVGFTCNWDAYGGLEMAGQERQAYPADIRLVRLTCLGRLHLGLILKAFEMGADGVVLLGCGADRCRYQDSVTRAREVLKKVRQLFDVMGIERSRVALYEVPLGDGEYVAGKLRAFTKQIRKFGPCLLREKIPA